MNKHIESLDYAKSVILLVLLLHVVTGFIDAGMLSSEWLNQQLDIWRYISFTMPVFFFLSGILAARSIRKPLNTFIDARLRGLAYPYFLWSIIALLVATVGASLSNTGRALSGQALLDILINPTSIYWFLYVLFFVQMIYGVLVKRNLQALSLYLAIALFVLGEFVNVYLVAFWLGKLTSFFIFFAVGAHFSGQFLDHLTGVNVKRLWLLSLLCWSGYAMFWLFVPDFNVPFVSLLAQTLALAGVLSACEIMARARTGRFLHFIGLMTMEIYLIHNIVNSSLRIVLTRLLDLPVFIAFPVVILAALVIPIIIGKIVEHYRIPYVFRYPLRASPKRELEPA